MADQVRHFRVAIDGEYGSFYLREGIERSYQREYHWCELTCNTSFGVVGHYWGSMGMPAARFLAKVERGYVLNKLWGSAAKVFDSDEAMRDVRRIILRERRDDSITHVEARERWDELSYERPDGEFEFRELVYNTPWLYRHLCEGGGPIGMISNPQADGFWTELWPSFIAQLSAADAPTTLANVTPPRDLRTQLHPAPEESTNG